jgi:hypothetical protein
MCRGSRSAADIYVVLVTAFLYGPTERAGWAGRIGAARGGEVDASDALTEGLPYYL